MISLTTDETVIPSVHYVIYTSCKILHRDLSVNNIMFTRRDGRIIGILNDWDLAASTKLRDKATSKHRTGTAAFMALDLLKNAGGPLLHEYHHDLESFVWILLWCAVVLRFDGNEVEWEKQPDMIQQWTNTTNAWNTIAHCKRGFVMDPEDYLQSITPEMKGLKKSWIQPVLRGTSNTISVRSTYAYSDSEEEEDSLPNCSGDTTNVQMPPRRDPVFFTFQHVMKVLEPSTETPDEAVWKYGSPALTVA